jgi:GNAT superfamily N-acetyltransferase
MNNNYEIKLLASDEALHFKAMTYSQYEPSLERMDDAPGRLFPVGLFYKNEPAGLLLGTQKTPREELYILSIFIEKQHRGRKLSHKMLKFLEEKCGELKIACMKTFYYNNRPFVPAIDKLFDKCGFDPAEPSTFFCKCDKNIANMPILEYTTLPGGFETLRWPELDLVDKEKLKNELTGMELFDVRLSPFKDVETIVPGVSLWLKKGGSIAGWAISNFIEGEKTILYSSIFLMPEIRGLGLGIALLMRSIREHVLTDLAEKYPYALFEVRYDNPMMLKIIKKKFARHAVEQYDHMTRKKTVSINETR